MATLFMDGFDHYGAVLANMASLYASLPSGNAGLGAPAWGTRTGLASAFNVDDPGGFRWVLPSGSNAFYASFGFSCDSLPPANNYNRIISFNDADNNVIAWLTLQSTGTLALYTNTGSPTVLATTDGPVIQAATWYQFNVEYTANSGITVYIGATNNVQEVLSGVTGYTPTACAQIALIAGPDVVGTLPYYWLDDLYINDLTGTFNNTNPGELQIATLEPNANVGAFQGWTPNPRQLFGTGLLDTTANTSFADAAAASMTLNMESTLDLGTADFTAEGWFRFQQTPTGSNYAHLLGAWYVGTVLSYELALCGPSLNSGNMVWRVSTDGSSTTNVVSWPFVPVLNQWYHIAVSRVSGETMLFIGGVQQGPAVADSNNYHASTTFTFGVGGAGFGDDGASWFQGWVEEMRMTVGVGRYAANFAPPSAEFPVGGGSDAHWTSVQLLANFDGSGPVDLSQNAYALTLNNGAVVETPNDGAAAYEVIAKTNPFDDTYIAAPLLPATAIYTQTLQPVDGATVTVATKDGSAAAVYRFKNTMAQAYDVKIGANLQTSLANLTAAINAGPGSGTAYFTGTLVNNDVTAQQLPLEQIEVIADIAGTVGNSLACSTTSATGSWSGTTLAGGTNIPPKSMFNVQKPPLNTTFVAAVQIVSRQYKTDSGTCETNTVIAGPGGSTANGAPYFPSTNASYHCDVFDSDPDTNGAWTPTAVVGCSIGINRTE